ncbi:gluconokinase [Actinomadura sp. 7K534]|uniref:gluconokinase n=1 Tax=Actinomadura sp. 7K534 TaxID=2530366 RepID=UPI001047B417|nr:gluconokinase [Actinomadura sp. 7K534]TDB95737.1 gluconokinase [Actinomadura sp. 7K534]
MIASVHIVVMGVSGCGKSTIARRLRDGFGLKMAEADDFHPPANIAKMSGGEPLTDDDRWPWLEALARWTADQRAAGTSTVLACSALKRSYRDVLRAPVPDTYFLHLHGAEELLLERMRSRDHFMPPTLLRSQFETLEPLEPDEHGALLDVAPPVDEVARQATQLIRPLFPSDHAGTRD